MEDKKVRLTYHLRKKQAIEYGIGIAVDLKYFLAVYMVIGYGIYALTGNKAVMYQEAFLLALMVVLSYFFRNYIKNQIGLIIMQLLLIAGSQFWCRYSNEKILCLLFLSGWSIYSLSVRIKEKEERTFRNEGLFAILLGIPMEVLADYYHYIPVKSLVFWLGFFMILLHFLIKYMIDFMKYFEQAGQANITIRQIKLKSHLLLAAYGVIGMGVMLMASRLPLQGIWNSARHGIYLLLKKFFHMLEGDPVQTRWDPTPTPIPTAGPKGDITTLADDSQFLDLEWLRKFYDYLFEMIRVAVIVGLILAAFRLVYAIFQKLSKKEKGIEEEKEFIHLSEIKKKAEHKLDNTKKENIKGNRRKVRKLFVQLMKKSGMDKNSGKSHMTSHEMCDLSGIKEPDIVEKIYQKARYSKEKISDEDVTQIKETLK